MVVRLHLDPQNGAERKEEDRGGMEWIV
jgi:hypothetical protein